MTVQTRPLADVTRRAIEILTRELGATDTIRFVNQFMTGLGDYTTERDQLFGEETLDSILDAIKAKDTELPAEPAASKKSKGGRKKRRQSPGGPTSGDTVAPDEK